MANHDKKTLDDEPEVVSKSQLKRDAKVLFMLGKKLSELPPSQLDTLALDETLHEAICDARAIRSHVARKRQLGFVAKLLRNIDAQPLFDAMDRRDNNAGVDTVRLHRSESWRDALIEQGDNLLSELIRQRGDADPQLLRQLVRNARKELANNKPPASARKLFKQLRMLDETRDLPDLPA